MAHWSEAAITQAGIDRLNEMMAGRKLRLTAAAGGTGRVDFGELGAQTALLDQRQDLRLLDEQDGPQGKTVTVQITNREVAEKYILEQIGIFGRLDGEAGSVLLSSCKTNTASKCPRRRKRAFCWKSTVS